MSFPSIFNGMDRRAFPVLSSEEDPHIDRLAAGLGDTAARVFVYLWRRSTASDVETDAATEMAIRIGTGSSRNAIQTAIGQLEERELVESAAVEASQPGRPPNAWRVTRTFSSAAGLVYDQHAEHLLDQSRAIQPWDSDSDAIDDRWADTEGETLTVGLNWSPNELQLPLFAAEDGGCYSDRGLSVEWQPFAGSAPSIEAVLSGEVTLGVAGAATVTRARARDRPLVPIATVFQRPMVVLYTTRDVFGERFETVEQLRGRTVGMPVESETGILARLFLTQAGVLDDVTVADLDGEESDALVSGAVDVVTGIFSDPIRLESTDAAVDSIHVADQYPIYGPTIVTSETALRTRRASISRFLAGTTAGWALANLEPRKVALELVGETDRDAGRMTDIFRHAVSEFGLTEDVSRFGWGWQESEPWNRLETAMDRTDLV